MKFKKYAQISAFLLVLTLSLMLVPTMAFADKSEEQWSCRWFNIGCSEFGITANGKVEDTRLVFEKRINDELVAEDTAVIRPRIEFVDVKESELSKVRSRDVFVGDGVVAFDSSKYNIANTFNTRKVEVTREVPIFAESRDAGFESIDGLTIEGNQTAEIIGYETVTEIVDTGIIATVDFGQCANNVFVYEIYKHPQFLNDKDRILTEGILDGYAQCVPRVVGYRNVTQPIYASEATVVFDEETGKSWEYFEVVGYKEVEQEIIQRRIEYDVRGFSSFASTLSGLNTGIVAYYKLDEISGTTAVDSVSGLNGTANNARVFTSEEAGIINTAGDFTQGNDFITLPSSVGSITGDLTISAWVKTSTIAAGEAFMVAQQNSALSEHGYLLWRDGSAFRWANRPGGTAAISGTISTGTWYHLVGISNSSGNFFFINGVLNATGNKGSGTISGTPYIGRRDSGNYFNGIIDEVALWNRSLSAEEIEVLYDLQVNQLENPQYPFYYSFKIDAEDAWIGGELDNFSVNTLGSPHFDRNGTVEFDWLRDQSGNDNDGLAFGGVDVSVGKFGSGAHFNGVDGRITTPIIPNTVLPNNFTLAGWLRVDGNLGDYQHLFHSRSGNNGFWFSLRDDNRLEFFVRDGTGTSVRAIDTKTFTSSDLGNWIHVVVVYDGIRGYIYRDSQVVANPVLTGNAYSPSSLAIGLGTESGNTNFPFKGQLDEVRIYDRALSAQEIQALYENNTMETDRDGLQLYMPFTVVEQGKPIGAIGVNDGTVSGGVNITDNALNFNGVDGYVNVNTISLTNWSFATWVKLEVDTADRHILSKWNTAGNQRSFTLITLNIPIRGLGIQTSPDGTSTSGTTIVSSTQLNLGEYYFVVGTYDGLRTRLYINNNLEATSSSDIAVFNSNANINLGRVSFGNYFNGSQTDVLIFNKALSQSEITAIYNAGKDAYSPITDGLVFQASGRDYEGNETNPTLIYNMICSNETCHNLDVQKTDYFPRLYEDVDTNNPITAGLIKEQYADEGNFTITDLWTSEVLTTHNITVQGVNYNSNQIDFEVQKTDYFTRPFTNYDYSTTFAEPLNTTLEQTNIAFTATSKVTNTPVVPANFTVPAWQLYMPDVFTNPNNAFDKNVATEAERIESYSVTGIKERNFGRISDVPIFVDYIYLNYEAIKSGTSTTHGVSFDIYNGTDWIEHTALQTMTATTPLSGELNISISDSIFGARIRFRHDQTTTGSRTFTARVKEFGLYTETKGVGEIFPLTADNHTVLFSADGWFDKSMNFTTTPLQNQTLIVENTFNKKHNVTLNYVNGTNATLENFTIAVMNEQHEFFQEVQGNGSISNSTILELEQGLVYNITISGPQFKTKSVLTSDLSSMNTAQSITITETGFTNLSVTVRDEDTNNLISQNVTLLIDRFTSTDSYTIPAGNSTFIIPELNSNLRFVFSSDGYGTRTILQDFSGENPNTHNIDMLLLNVSNPNAQTVTFRVTDSGGNNLVGAKIKIEQITPDGVLLYEQKNTDIAGLATFVLDLTKTYSITISKAGFVTQNFFLDLVTTSYTIVLEKEAEIAFSDGYEGVTYTINPEPPRVLPESVEFSVNFTATASNLDSVTLRLSNTSNPFQTIAIQTYNNVGAGGVLSVTGNLTAYNNSQVDLRITYNVVGRNPVFRSVRYEVRDFVFLTGSMGEFRAWIAVNMSITTRIVLFIFLMFVTLAMLAVFLRGETNLIVTLALTVSYAYALSISLLALSFIYVIAFTVIYASSRGREAFP